MAIPAQTLTVELTSEEATLMFDIAEAQVPGSTGQSKKEWAQSVAKAGLRTELGRIQLETIRQQENQNRQAERAEFGQAFPEVPIIPPTVPEPEPPVEG